MEQKVSVAFIGLGNMGKAMAGHILKAGFPLTVWNRTPDKARSLLDGGAKLAPTPAAAAREADVVVSSLMGDDSVRDVLHGPDGLLAGVRTHAIHVSTSTISPMAAEEFARAHAQRGAVYVAAPVLGRPTAAEAAKLRSFVAGQDAAVRHILPIISTYSQNGVSVVGENVAHANVLKLSANFTLMATMELSSEVMTLNEKWGVDPKHTKGILDLLLPFPNVVAYNERISAGEFEAAGGFTLRGGLKDCKLVVSTSDAVGASMPLADVVRQHMVTAAAVGLGDADWCAFTEANRVAAGLPVRGASKSSHTEDKTK